MFDEAETIHQLGDFIQCLRLGAVVRRWLELNEQERIAAIHLYRRQSSPAAVERLATVLLNLAAGYPNSEVRRKLVRTYALFVRYGDTADTANHDEPFDWLTGPDDIL